MNYNISRFFQFFLPKESKFLPLLRGQVADILKATDLLIEFIRVTGQEDRKRLYVEIKKIETHCDDLTNEIVDELNKTFITPFDREDIHLLAAQLDDLLDLINGSAKRVVLYQPREMPASMVQMAEHIREGALCIQTAVIELGKKRRNDNLVLSQCRRLHEIENTADDVYENFIISLFKQEKDAIELLKQVEIMQLLESATDKAYRVAEVLKTIVVKYS
ncbi:MAG: DUF47 family protein [Rikenellaceae bacterium]|jgi:uncharacterized protein Yka (UPF0111/DUF47 family)|nr:DUF47 family protein [Rikenellaceae bacterium]